MNRRVTIFSLLFPCLMVPFLSAQEPNQPISLDSDIRTFSVMAALHAAGFDQTSTAIHPSAVELARELRKASPALKQKLTEFFESHREGSRPEDQITKYLSLALLTEGPPDFKLALPLNDLPPDASSVFEFLTLVKQFYQEARIEVIWSQFRSLYDKAIIDYRPVINQILLTTDGYLRIPSGSYLGRRLVIIPEYLVPSNVFNARTYRENYYLVFGPSDTLKTEEIRHQYLHFLLDPFAVRYPLPKESRGPLMKMVETLPNLDEQYRRDFAFMITESLVKAVELRMDQASEKRVTQELDLAILSGALLARHFYQALSAFEQAEEGFRIYFRGLINGIQPEQIQGAYDAARAKPAPNIAEEQPREPTEVERMLQQAHHHLATNELERAAEIFKAILNRFDSSNGEALYGLGIIATSRSDKDSARHYFGKALEVPSTPKSVAVWAHIYLGRLYDLEDNRKDAILQYQAAIETGDDTRNAQEVAQRGLREPFNPRK